MYDTILTNVIGCVLVVDSWNDGIEYILLFWYWQITIRDNFFLLRFQSSAEDTNDYYINIFTKCAISVDNFVIGVFEIHSESTIRADR